MNNADNDRDLAQADRNIEWIIDHPGTSDWVRQSLKAARGSDPGEVLVGIELLAHLLKPRAESQIRQAITKANRGAADIRLRPFASSRTRHPVSAGDQPAKS